MYRLRRSLTANMPVAAPEGIPSRCSVTGSMLLSLACPRESNQRERHPGDLSLRDSLTLPRKPATRAQLTGQMSLLTPSGSGSTGGSLFGFRRQGSAASTGGKKPSNQRPIEVYWERFK